MSSGRYPDRNGDLQFRGSIPEIYDRFLVPLIFEGYALELAKCAARSDPKLVLETAAGTGVLTRALCATLPYHTRIVATDLNQPMLDFARGRKPKDTYPVEWKQADALALPFQDASFDVVACQFGVMFFPDKNQGYKEARRVLRPHGLFYFNVWDRLAENEFAETITEALADMFPEDPPSFLARTPHGYYDVERIRTELQNAGFGQISIGASKAVSRAPSPLEAAIAYCQGTPLRNEIESRDASRLGEATNEAAIALARRFGNGPIEGRIRALVIAAAN